MDMQSIYLSDQHAAFRVSVRELLNAHVRPHAEHWEERRAIPADAWLEIGKHGLLGLLHAKEHGGQALDLFHSIVFLEELAKLGYGGIRAGLSVHAYMATHYLGKYANADLQQRYLAPSIRGEKVTALAITEWEAGSDLSRLATTAEKRDDHLVINGTKTFITNGMNADYYVVAVRTAAAHEQKRTNTGISLVIVDAHLPGITVNAQEKVGWHSAGTAEICFADVEIPATHIIGRMNSGFMYLMRGFQLERLVAAVLALGGVDYCLQSTLAYVTSRQAFSGKLSDLQTVRHRLAGLATELLSARMLAYHAAWTYERDELAVKECSMAKLQATELACRAADECLQLQGARGYLASSDIGRVSRDARAGAMAGGATEIMRDIISQQMIDMRAGV